jgi:dihydrofolate reductase
MRVSLIVAASANNVIGVRGELPWRLPADLRRFKQVTTGKPIVMGRLTWDSIGRPLPNRQNIVISRNPDFTAAGCDIVASPDEAIDMAGDVDELMIIGGGQLYREFLPRAQRIYLTRVAVNIAGDASFPELEAREWSETSREPHPADEEHAYSFEIIQLERIEPQ